MSTINTIFGTANFCAAFILNRPTQGVANAYQDPTLTLANLTMSTILAPPFAWQWNRVIAAPISVTAILGTDYQVALPNFGWLEKATIAYVTPPVSGPSVFELEIITSAAIDSRPNRPFKICPVLDDNTGNITFRLFPTPDVAYTLSLTYQNAPVFATTLFGPSIGAITSIAAAVAGSTVYTASGGVTGGAANGLAGAYLIISTATSNANNGVFYCTASSATTVTVNNQNGILQSGAGGTIQTGTTWAPIPDKYNFLYERAMKAHFHGMYDTAMYLQELQLFFRQLVGCSEGLSDTAKAIFLEDRLTQLRTEAAAQSANTATPKRAQ